ncbi:MAG: toll/interleukin-1 receptor domain-containing protein [Acidimicrobiia bacterium]|nr:toll/interleukin-1 receptor domain-containing protein [Acidimicrobiia bacterium]
MRDVVNADVERERDVFLCHAWADRTGAATDLFEALSSLSVDVWFSEREVVLGRSLARQLDAGLRVSRVGIVLVTPNMLVALRNGGFADKELGALLATDRVIPVSDDVTYDELRAESPLLASRAGLSTSDSSLGEVAAKIAESVLGVDLD